VKSLSREAVLMLMDYGYPGNVRELENIIERGVALADDNIIDLDSLPQEIQMTAEQPVSPAALPADGIDLDSLMEKYERELIETALARSGGNRTKAARILGISFRSLRYRLKKFGSDDVDPEPVK